MYKQMIQFWNIKPRQGFELKQYIFVKFISALSTKCKLNKKVQFR